MSGAPRAAPDESTQYLLDTLFPFHVVIGSDGCVAAVGAALARASPGLNRRPFLEAFDPIRPSLNHVRELPAAQAQVAVLGIRGTRAELRGQYLALGESMHAFVGSPRIVDADSRAAWPIGIGDFAPHDGTADYSMALEAVQLQLSELDRLATQLNDSVRVQRQLREKAEGASRSKSHFLANVSHEIRTPMTVILGYVDLLREPSTTEDERRVHLETIKRNGEHLLALLSDVLDYSRLESGQFSVTREAMHVTDAVRDAVHSLGVRARQAGLVLSWSGETEETSSTVLCDAVRLRQVVMNLVTNAIKFTPRGSVHVHVSAQPWDGLLEFRIEVRDTGCGIPESLIPSLFEPFRQMESQFFRESGGAGLGLAICSSIARALDGRIEVSSEVGRGSRFTLAFKAPLVRPTHGTHADSVPDPERVPGPERDALDTAEGTGHPLATTGPDGSRLLNRRVLIVEDSVDTQRLFAHWLGKAGASLGIVDDGLEAVEFIAAVAAGRESTPDVILMDMQLPGIDGIEATQRIRAMGFRGTIVGLSATGQQFVQDRATSAGCDQYRVKPLLRSELIEACRGVAGSHDVA